MKKIALKLIQFYQRSISPDHGLFKYKFLGCRFYPTCSEYLYRTIDNYGLIAGGAKGLRRVLRCNPLNPGGVDLP